MKISQAIFTLSAITALITGCASTNKELPRVNGEIAFPPLTVISDEVYEWDNKKSEAMNIVQLALPAEIGNGLRDMTNGENATTGRIKGGERVLFSALSLVDSGFFGVFTSESLVNGVNNMVDWKPTIVEYIESDSNKVPYLKIRDTVLNKVANALRKSFPGIKLGDKLTLKDDVEHPIAILQIFSYDICAESRKFEALDKDISPFKQNHNPSQFYHEGKDKIEEYCSIAFEFHASKRVSSNRVAVVAELKYGLYFAPYLSDTYDGYMIFPDFYELNGVESVVTKHAYVSKSGEILLFEKPEKQNF